MPKPFTQHTKHESVPIVEFAALQEVADKHGVDADELNLQANLYHYNLNILNNSIADKRKRYLLILKYIEQEKHEQAIDAYDASDFLPEALDLSLDDVQEYVESALDRLPEARKGPSEAHRHSFVLNLSKLYPQETSRSHSNGVPCSRFFEFCRDVFNAIGGRLTDGQVDCSIREVIKRTKKQEQK